MPLKYSNIGIPEGCHEILREIKNGQRYNYLIFTIKGTKFLDVTDTGNKHETYESLLSKIKGDQCCYILCYHHDLLPESSGPVLIAWIPNESIKREMYYRALMIVKTLLKVDNLLIVDDVENITAQTLEKSIKKAVDATDANLIHTPPLDYVPDSRGLGFVYYHCMQKYKDNVAQIDGSTGKTQTYAELLQSATTLAISMRKGGVQPGDIISICSQDHESVAIPILATLFLGATVSAVDTAFSVDDFIEAFRQVKPKLIFVEAKVVERVTLALRKVSSDTKVVVFGSAYGYTSFFDLIEPTGEKIDFEPVTVKSLLETALIFFTSGSTGIPKTICHYHYSILYQYFNLRNTGFCWDIIFHLSTPYWTVYSIFLGMSILQGTSRLFFSTLPDEYWIFTKYKVTTVFFTPTDILTLITQERPKSIDLRGVRFMLGGNIINEKQMQQLRRIFYDADIYAEYGLSEIPGILTLFKSNNSNDLELDCNNPISIGLTLPGISYKVVDPKTDEALGPNNQGELRIKTSFPTGGYYRIHSSPLWDAYGWIKTGDLAYYNEDRCLFILGRLKEVFKCRDYHIIPAKLESILQSHPAVEKVAVIGIPHEVDGHQPLGVVVLKANQSSVTPKVLEEYVEGKVEDEFRLRGGVKIVDKIPVTPTGKMRKWLLEKMFVKKC